MSNLGEIAIARDRFHGNEVYHRKMFDHTTQIDFSALRVIKCNFLPAYINIGQTFVLAVRLVKQGTETIRFCTGSTLHLCICSYATLLIAQ